MLGVRFNSGFAGHFSAESGSKENLGKIGYGRNKLVFYKYDGPNFFDCTNPPSSDANTLMTTGLMQEFFPGSICASTSNIGLYCEVIKYMDLGYG